MKKEELLNKLRKNTHVQFDMPAVEVKGIQYEDTLRQFVEMTESVGGHVIEAKEGESLDELVKRAYPEAKVFASHLPEITIAQKNPRYGGRGQRSEWHGCGNSSWSIGRGRERLRLDSTDDEREGRAFHF